MSSEPSLKQRKADLVEAATNAVAEFPQSDIEVALSFLSHVVPAFCTESNDRLVKVGRCVRSLIELKDEIPLEESLALLVEECNLLIKPDGFKVPKVRFGRTELQMPIVTLGCMRFQQQWGPKIQTMNQVYSDCQENLVSILKRAILDYGINHIETARGYGSSELQIGVALKQLFMTGMISREDLIIQTKIPAKENVQEFRDALEVSFKNLQIEYLDLFGFHGFNGQWQWDWIFGTERGENCWDVLQEYKKAGKIRHIGFSTHGPNELICKAINTGKFDYVNLHHHFCGSYTASGDGVNGTGNISCLRLMKKLDMGAFIISANDKGGKVYAPSKKLRSLTLPDTEPMTYGMGFLWNIDKFDQQQEEGAAAATVHTLSVGAARPVDLDQCAVAAYWQGQGGLYDKIKSVSIRLEKAKIDALGKEWVDTCFTGIVKSYKSKHLIEHNQIIWLYNCLKAWGLYEFAKDRFRSLVNNRKKYNPQLTNEENIDKMGRAGWGFVPGFNPDLNQDYFQDDLINVPEQNRARVKEAYEFVTKWCMPKQERQQKQKKEGSNGNDVDEEKEEELTPPKEWETSFEMKPWKDFPDRPYP